MKLFFVYLLAVLAIAHKDKAAPLDCFIVQQPAHTECFTFSYPIRENHMLAMKSCKSLGGQLSLITDEPTWELLIDKFLQDFTRSSGVLVGYSFRPSGQIYPVRDLSNMTSYWSQHRIRDESNSIVAYAPNWQWGVARFYETYPYFCQYNVTSCSTFDIKDPNAIIKSCFSKHEIPFEKTVQVKCRLGNYLNTSSTITCRKGIWDDVQCVPGCPPPGNRNNAQFNSAKKYYHVGDVVTYTCNEGYYSWEDLRLSYFNLTCQFDSTWSDQEAECNVRQEFSISIINVTRSSSRVTKLECNLNASETTWFQNGEYVVASGLQWIEPSGDLMLNVVLGYSNGFYLCFGKVNDRLQVGKTAFDVIGSRIRYEIARESSLKGIKVQERVDFLLSCRQDLKNDIVTWFKDDEEIFNTGHRSIIPGVGLLLTNTTLQDEGMYKCHVVYGSRFSNFNTTYDLSVIPHVESICGREKFYRSKQTWYQPWLATLINDEDDAVIPFCYGTLLNNKWVITPASCLISLKNKKLMDRHKVQLGRVGYQEEFLIVEIKIHPQYKRGDTASDVGLLRLSKPQIESNQFEVKLTSRILPACISSEDIGNIHKCEHVADLTGTVAGWGSWIDDKTKNIVDVENMSVLPKEVCRNATTKGFAEDKFCAKFNGNEERFLGDTGSPFIVQNLGRSYLLGIYSWGQRNFGTGVYDYYTSISFHYDWIISIIS